MLKGLLAWTGGQSTRLEQYIRSETKQAGRTSKDYVYWKLIIGYLNHGDCFVCYKSLLATINVALQVLSKDVTKEQLKSDLKDVDKKQ